MNSRWNASSVVPSAGADSAAARHPNTLGGTLPCAPPATGRGTPAGCCPRPIPSPRSRRRARAYRLSATNRVTRHAGAADPSIPPPTVCPGAELTPPRCSDHGSSRRRAQRDLPQRRVVHVRHLHRQHAARRQQRQQTREQSRMPVHPMQRGIRVDQVERRRPAATGRSPPARTGTAAPWRAPSPASPPSRPRRSPRPAGSVVAGWP